MNQAEPKAKYTTPQLIEYGTVEDLTRGPQGTQQADNLSAIPRG